MNDLARLLQDVEAVGPKIGGRQVLDGVLDLFAFGAATFDVDHLAVFDAVFERLLLKADEAARAAIAQRLIGLPHAPPETLRRLAHDEIAVARPILAGWPSLADQDLIAVSISRGRDHMLAICERHRLSEVVTDVLVAQGDAVVHHAVAANPTARFSRLSVASLIDFAGSDDTLLELLGERRDLPDGHARQIVRMAQQRAQFEPHSALPLLAKDDGVGRLAAAGQSDSAALPTEQSLAEDAWAGRHAAVLTGLAYLSGLPVVRARKLYEEKDDELLIVVARARGWSFDTVRALMTGRQDPADRHLLWRTERAFASLSASTASRILRFIRLRNRA